MSLEGDELVEVDSPPTSKCTLRHQRVQLQIDIPNKCVQGCTELSFEVESTEKSLPITTLSLHSRQLDIKEILVDEFPAEYTLALPESPSLSWQDKLTREELSISWENNPKRENFVVKVTYEMNDPQVCARFHGGSQFYALPLPHLDLARYWLPCVDRIDTACQWDFEYSVTAPDAAAYKIVSSGMLISEFLNEEGTGKRAHFKLEVSTPAGNIGMVVGHFESTRIASAHFALGFCPMSRLSRLALQMEFVSRALGFYNWYLSQSSPNVISFPYPCMYFVFARGLPQSSLAVANLAVLSMDLLPDQSVIDQVWETRQALCEVICHQYIWQKISWADCWIPLGLKSLLVAQHLRVFHGNSDYKLKLRLLLNEVLEVEGKNPRGHGFAVYNPSRTVLEFVQSREYLETKSCLVMALLEQRLGKQNMQRLITQMYTELQTASPTNTEIFPLATVYFFKTAKRLTGKDLRSFIEQWVYSPECLPRYSISFVYNRAKSVVELNFDEELGRRIHGSVLIRVHETEGTYDHLVHLDEPHHHFELPYHTRTRKQRVPKVKAERTVLDSIDPPPLRGETTETDNVISPVLWLRVDPDQEWLGLFGVQQADTMWVEQLENDRDVGAQWEALQALQRFTLLPEAALFALERVILDVKVFYKIRCEAANTLSVLKPTPLPCIRKLLEIYTKRHAHRDLTTNEVIPRSNNFNDSLPNYFVQCALLAAIGSVRDGEKRPMEPIIRFFTDFLRHNDNTLNAYSDGYMVGEMLRQLGRNLKEARSFANPALIEGAQGQIERYARLDGILPSHRNHIMQVIVEEYDRFQSHQEFYFNSGNHWELRLQAFKKEFGLLPEDHPHLYYECLRKLVNHRHHHDGIGIEKGMERDLLAEAIVVGKSHQEQAQEEMKDSAMEQTRLPIVEVDWLSEMTGERTPLNIPNNNNNSVSGRGLKIKLAVKPTCDWKGNAREALDALWSSFDSYPFRYPVDSAVPGYFTMIKTPMDLSTIRRKLEQGEYTQHVGLEQLLLDVRLVFDNCSLFNIPGSLIVEQANRLKKQALKEFKQRFPEQVKLIKQCLKGSVNEALPKNNNSSLIEVEVTPEPVVMMPIVQLERESMRGIWKTVYEHENAFWFREPVDHIALNLPTYPMIIKEPMDLGTIGDRIGTFSSEEFCRLMRLVFSNCCLFNDPSTLVYLHATQLKEYFESLLLNSYTPKMSGSNSLPTSNANPTTSTTINHRISLVPAIKLRILKLPQPMTEEDRQRLRTVIEALQQHPYALPFNQPVDPIALNLPTYPRVIKKPMDFGTIASKIPFYSSLDEFKDDIDLVLKNCLKFNGPKAEISDWARQVQAYFDELWSEVFG